MTFENLQLAPPILKALNQCDHTHPTPIQAAAIPEVLAGRDLIASAQTGTGKTAAFVLPALQRLASEPRGEEPGVRVLVITPTRELANQISQVARAYGKYLDVHSVAIYGGMPFGDQIRALSQIPDMIIATPGRLIDHIWRGRIGLSAVQMLVLDEADRMLDMGFVDDVEFISDVMPEGCQTLLFAATMNEATTKLAHKFMKDPQRVEIAPGLITHEAIEQRLYMTDGLEHKNRILAHLCEDASLTMAIVFSATKRDAESLARALKGQGHAAAALHADMTQAARNHTIADMRRKKLRLLVATDVAARGIDVTGISHVINFDLPRSAEDYVNRIGRTGRAGESGVAISLVSRADLTSLKRIESYLGKAIPIETIPGLEPQPRSNRPRSKTGRRAGAEPEKSGAPSGRKRRSKGRRSADTAGAVTGTKQAAAVPESQGAARSGEERKPRIFL